MHTSSKIAGTLVFLAALLSSGAAFAQPTGLPGGATSLNETHGDWRVQCATGTEPASAAVTCSVLQEQTDNRSGQRVLAVQMIPSDGGTTGTLILPFGLALDNGVTLAVDEQAPMAPLRFSTCLPAGCLVPLTLDAATTEALRSGTSLKIAVTALGGEQANLTVSLNGLAGGLDRAAALLATPQ